MEKLASRVFFQIAFVLAILSFLCVWIVDAQSAEYYIVLITGIINCCVVLIGLVLAWKRRKNK